MKKFLVVMLCLVMMLCMMPAMQVKAADSINITSFASAQTALGEKATVTFDGATGTMTIVLQSDIDGDIWIDITDKSIENSSETVQIVRLDANEKNVTGALGIGANVVTYDGKYVLTGDGTFNELRVDHADLSIESVTVNGEINMYAGNCSVVASCAEGNDFALVKIGDDAGISSEIFFTDTATGTYSILGSTQLQGNGLIVKQYRSGDTESVEIGNTGDIVDIDTLREKLGAVADITENGDKINVKLNYNIQGRIAFAMPGKTINFDANGKIIDGEGYDEPICVNHTWNNQEITSLVLNGDGTYLAGGNYVLYVGINGNITIHSGTFDSNGKTILALFGGYAYIKADVDENNGYNCFVTTDATGRKTTYYNKLDVFYKEGNRLVVKPHKAADSWSKTDASHWHECELCGENLRENTHSFGNDGKCNTCGYERTTTPTVTAPILTNHPADVSVDAGDIATFSVTATGDGLTYQWQIERNDGNGFVNIEGATRANCQSSATDIACNGFKYRCVVTNPAGSVTSNAATLIIRNAGGASGTPEPTPTPTPEPTPIPVPAPVPTPTPIVPAAPTYTILEGANSGHTVGTTEVVTVRVDGDFAKFSGVKVNDVLVDAKYYTAVSGSTIVTLKQEYLDTLAEGTYKISIVFSDGECSTNFQIHKVVTSPKTSDNGILWGALFLMSSMAIIGTTVYKKRQVK